MPAVHAAVAACAVPAPSATVSGTARAAAPSTAPVRRPIVRELVMNDMTNEGAVRLRSGDGRTHRHRAVRKPWDLRLPVLLNWRQSWRGH
ncbi:hypothetical protein GCM10010218_46220 [Streptomyces mashuensis]|uniref:Uncharacterized protein n=1 Tax=Streptomyces mashuensis TaxID=33904 RepID=A0A919B7Q3_9ACTN|nr:hypothetical protein GCM10010218_46220 [Streptomyces mashuensis]